MIFRTWDYRKVSILHTHGRYDAEKLSFFAVEAAICVCKNDF